MMIENVTKYFCKSEETQKGHMKKQHQHVPFMKLKLKPQHDLVKPITMDVLAPTSALGLKHHDVYSMVYVR